MTTQSDDGLRDPAKVQDPAKVHAYITTISNRNIGRPAVWAGLNQGFFTPDLVYLPDIARSLAMSVRYYGHLERFYSVAEHSVLVSRIAELKGDREAVMPALMHDAHEAYMGDIASPQKPMMGPGVADFERRMERVVRQALGLDQVPAEVWARVRQYDIAILHREIRVLRRTLPNWYSPQADGLVPHEVQPIGLEWRDAEQFFWNRLQDLRFAGHEIRLPSGR